MPLIGDNRERGLRLPGDLRQPLDIALRGSETTSKSSGLWASTLRVDAPMLPVAPRMETRFGPSHGDLSTNPKDRRP